MNPRRVAFFYNNPSGLQPEEAELANILYLAWASATLLLNRRNCQTRGSAIFVFIMWWNKTREPGWCHPQPGRHRYALQATKALPCQPFGFGNWGSLSPLWVHFLKQENSLLWIYIQQFPISLQMTREPGWCQPQPGRHRLSCKPQRLCHTSPLGLAIGDHFSPQWVHFLEQENKSALDLYPALPLSTNDLWKLMES